MSAHAFLAPSAAARWVRCAYAPTLEAAYPETEESPNAIEGTAAHWVVQELLENRPVSVGAITGNGFTVNEEMLEAAGLVYDDVVDTLGPGYAQILQIERHVKIRRVHPSLNEGTPDLYAWRRDENGRIWLHIWDFKYGFLVVEAFEAWQILDYVAGILEEAGIDGIQDQEIIVDMCVIQPRAPHKDGPVRRWQAVASNLRGYFNTLANQAAEATGPEPRARPTPEGCRDCSGRHACIANQRAVFTAADEAQRLGHMDLSTHALGLELRTLKRAQALLASRITGLEAETESRLKRGEAVPFWLLDSVAGNLAWTKPVEEIIALGDMLEIELRKPQAAITPTQAKAKGLDDATLKLYAERPKGGLKLKPDDGSKARLTFSSSVAQSIPPTNRKR